MKTICGRCNVNPNRIGQRRCLVCHREVMREFRKTHSLKPDQRWEMNSRSYANTYQKRGKLIPQSCWRCGDPKAQKHHPDYSKPLEVEWLCRTCHLLHHQNVRSMA
jgi:hypothetical protein